MLIVIKSFILFCFLVSSVTMASSVRDEISALYPHLSKEVMEARFKAQESEFTFFRSFVPFFYKRVKETPSVYSMFQAYHGLSAWCVGDAHPDNFGVLLNEQQEPVFSINDADDGGPCLVFADLLRFYSGLKVFQPGLDLMPLFSAYNRGLYGISQKLSDVSKNLIKESTSPNRGTSTPKKWHDMKSPNRLLPADDLVDIKPDEESHVQQALFAIFGKDLEFKDIKRRVRFEGGSGGLERYIVLFEIKTKEFDSLKNTIGSDWIVLELKEIVRPGIFPMSSYQIPEPQLRLDKTILLEHWRTHSYFQRVVQIDKKDYMIRPRWRGNLGVEIAAINENEQVSVLLDEAYTLGLLHRFTVNDIVTYKKAIADTPASVWTSSAQEMAKQIKESYRAVSAP